MYFDNLTNENVTLYAVKAYDRPNCIMSEFKEDMKRFNYVKKLFKRYKKYNELREQLVLNHLIVLNNVFGVEVVTRLLFYKVPKEDYDILKTYLIFLSCMPERIRGIKGQDILSSDIPIDIEVANTLRQIQ